MSRYYIIARVGDVIKCEKTFTTKREATNACARLTKKMLDEYGTKMCVDIVDTRYEDITLYRMTCRELAKELAMRKAKNYNLTIDIDKLCNSNDVITLSELVKYFPRKYTIHEYMRLYDYIFLQKGIDYNNEK